MPSGILHAAKLEISSRYLGLRTRRARVNLAADSGGGSVQPLGLRTPEAVERKTAILPGPPTDYTLPRASVLNGCKPLVKDR